ncbi:hypothetical protein [Evansella cellulosilytica]|uniref:Uncharacterized protein n=1 Tax=Evansella cellulosilytica (strain ATCC 21833 / DSM 2522 / FERM P-1141 / JCM 9156 / N-4) TaxID=649639 RepID=E6TQL8_EVAC2|nr:hypothetical protein [Evansella cellulosilytica]ADU30529.1 hypothetical protein Bcell_2269 [Evansella cellulosilytica DSM 2522]
MGDEKIKEIEVRLEEIRHEIDQINAQVDLKTYKNDVKVMLDEYAKLKKVVTKEEALVLMDQVLNDKRYMTENDVKTFTKDIYLNILKWIVGTTISSVALIVGILRVLFN